MPEGATTSISMLCDWEAMCRALAAESPLWTPGTTIAYHAMTYGWLLGEVARRVTGKPFNQFVQEAICRPLGIDSLFFGIPDAVEPRVAVEEGAPEYDYQSADPVGNRAVPAAVPLVQMANMPDVRRAAIPGAAGIMNARALARHYAALIGEVDGVRLLSAQTTAYAGRPHREGIDANGGNFTRFALGYHTGRPGGTMGNRATVFGHGGYGGTLGFADPEYGMAFALHKNRVVVSPEREETVAYQVANVIREGLGIPVS
jgi:CubicO group peptidase (beta-lactamase class C family)